MHLTCIHAIGFANEIELFLTRRQVSRPSHRWRVPGNRLASKATMEEPK